VFHREMLPNGIRLVLEKVPSVYSASIGIWVKAGSRHEGAAFHGISHFLEHMLFKGTPTRNAKRIAEELEAVGGSLNAFTTKEYTCYYAKVLAEHLDVAADILTDMFFNSVLDTSDIDKEKKVVLEEIKMYEDSPDEIVHDLFARAVWDEHPLGRSILGTEDSVGEFTREMLQRYFMERYIPDHTVIAVAGNIDITQVITKLTELFGDRKGAATEQDQGVTPVYRPSLLSVEKDTEQVQLCIGTPGLPQQHDDIYVLHLLNNVLGGGISSRLFQEIREERGLAYSVYSYHTAYSDSGIFSIYAGTSPQNVQELISLIASQITKLRVEGISQEELERTKTQLKGNLLLGMESVGNRMTRMGKSELCFGRVITVEEQLKKMQMVTLEDIRRLISQLFAPNQFALSAIGPDIAQLQLENALERVNG